MILVLIGIAATVIGCVMIRKTKYFETAHNVGIALVVCGFIALLVMTLLIFSAHVGTSVIIAQNNIKYESLCKRQEIIKSNYEDVSKSDVIKDVAEWNKGVYGYQYWAYNPWTNWFCSRRVADNLKTIDMDIDCEVNNG